MVNSTNLEKMIYILRGHKVMLDSDLAELYGVETKRLNEQVKRNISRFPDGFMFVCNPNDLQDLRSQIATANHSSNWNHKRRSTPMAFTEYGVTMLCSVLNSQRAIQINIAIIKTFIELRKFLKNEDPFKSELKEFRDETTAWFKIVFQRLEDIETDLYPKIKEDKKK